MSRRRAVTLTAGALGGFLASPPMGRAATIDGDEAIDWTHAGPLLRPKLLPTYFTEAFPGLVHQPFSAKLVVAYSVDRGRTDEYIRQSLFATWGVDTEAVHERALANLDAMSGELPAAAQSADGVLFIAKGDGYDAARLLLPGLRRRVLAQLGGKAFAAVPARDLLMAWSADSPGRSELVKRIAKEGASRPHPLSDEVFVIAPDTVRPATAAEIAQ